MDIKRFQPIDASLIEELGGILERAFQREGGIEPNEDEMRRFIGLMNEVEEKARSYEAIAESLRQELLQVEGNADEDLLAEQKGEINRLRSELHYAQEQAGEYFQLRGQFEEYLARFG